jgi:hypothetical protein
VADPGQFDMFDMAMARVPQEMKEALLRNDPVVDSFLDKMIEGDARRFFIAARMWAFGAKTLKEFLLMQCDYTLKGLAEKIECPTLVCDNVADTVAGGRLSGSTLPSSARRITSCSRRRKEPTAIARVEHRCSSTPSRSTGSTRPWRRFSTDPSRRTSENTCSTRFGEQDRS